MATPSTSASIAPLAQFEAEALEWATTRGSRSGRIAWQFIQDLAGRLGKPLEASGLSRPLKADGASRGPALHTRDEARLEP